MASVTLLLKKNKADENGEMPVYIRITKDRKTKFISLGFKVSPDLWDAKKRRVKKKHRNHARFNNLLVQKLAEVEKIALDLELENKSISNINIRNEEVPEQSPSFINFFEDYLERIKKANKIGTFRRNRAILSKLKKYLKGKDLTFDKVTYHFIKKYEYYLRYDLGNATNTIHANLKVIRKLLNDAVREEIIQPNDNPFPRYQLKWEKTSKAYLTEEELAKIESLQLSKDHVIFHHRNMFIFSLYAGGLRISDILKLRWSNFNGTHISITVHKTKDQLSIKLPNTALRIIELYQSPENQQNDFIFPFLNDGKDYSDEWKLFKSISSNSAYCNKNLKIIAQKAGIDKHISFHCARHTFATRALRKGIRIEYVSKLLGHSAIKTTQIYAQIVNSELDDAMDVFNN